MRTALIIPALNEAPILENLISRVPRDLVDEVIVVDNGSTDGTGITAARAGARVVTEMRRVGARGLQHRGCLVRHSCRSSLFAKEKPATFEPGRARGLAGMLKWRIAHHIASSTAILHWWIHAASRDRGGW